MSDLMLSYLQKALFPAVGLVFCADYAYADSHLKWYPWLHGYCYQGEVISAGPVEGELKSDREISLIVRDTGGETLQFIIDFLKDERDVEGYFADSTRCSLSIVNLPWNTVESITAEPEIQAPVTGVVPIVRTQPNYPVEAALNCLQGWVSFEFTVNEQGEVRDILIMNSSDEIFEQPARDALKRWKYRPRVVDGANVATEGIRARINFNAVEGCGT